MFEHLLHRLLVVALVVFNVFEVAVLFLHGQWFEPKTYIINLLWAATGVVAWQHGSLD